MLVFFSDLDGGVSEEIHNTASVQGILTIFKAGAESRRMLPM